MTRRVIVCLYPRNKYASTVNGRTYFPRDRANLKTLLGSATEVWIGSRVYARDTNVYRVALRPGLVWGPDRQALDPRHDQAWVFWLDQYSHSICHHPRDEWRYTVEVQLNDLSGAGYAFLSLVPEVPDPTPRHRLDPNGYRASVPDWTFSAGGGWTGAVAGLSEEVQVVFGEVLRLRLRFTSAWAQTPVCVLTAADGARFE